MRFLSICILLLLPIVCLGQQKNTKIITDSSIVLGIVKINTYLSKSITDFCYKTNNLYIEKGKDVVVCGINICTNNLSDKHIDLYQVVYNNNLYYIEKENLLTDSACFEQIANFNIEKYNSFNENSIRIGGLLLAGRIQNAVKFLKNCKIKGLALLDYNVYDESEYTEGTGVKFEVYNPTSKTIKYIWFTVIGYNPVGDKVVERLKGSSVITLKAVGPIGKDESGTYDFNYAWYTDLVETIKITSIKVQYMDNAIKTIKNVNDMILPDEYYKLLNSIK